MRCLYCGRQLALLRKLTGGGEFCSDAHRQSYQDEYNRLALSRLLQSQSPGEDAPATLPTPSRKLPMRAGSILELEDYVPPARAPLPPDPPHENRPRARAEDGFRDPHRRAGYIPPRLKGCPGVLGPHFDTSPAWALDLLQVLPSAENGLNPVIASRSETCVPVQAPKPAPAPASEIRVSDAALLLRGAEPATPALALDSTPLSVPSRSEKIRIPLDANASTSAAPAAFEPCTIGPAPQCVMPQSKRIPGEYRVPAPAAPR